MKAVKVTATRHLLSDKERFSQVATRFKEFDIDIVCYLDLYYSDGFRHITNGERLEDYDLYWMGGLKCEPMRDGLNYYFLHLLNKKSVDPLSAFCLGNNKFCQLLFSHHYQIKIPQSLFLCIDSFYQSYIYIRLLENKFIYPFIAKDVLIDGGKGVFLISNRQDLTTLLEQKENLYRGFLFQEFIQNTGDVRVVVMGDKVIGSFKRYNANSFKNNISTGGKEEPYKISHDLEKKSIDICKKYGLGVAGLDFFIAQEGPIFIEINKRPEYRGFESATGIDFVYELLSYFKTL